MEDCAIHPMAQRNPYVKHSRHHYLSILASGSVRASYTRTLTYLVHVGGWDTRVTSPIASGIKFGAKIERLLHLYS